MTKRGLYANINARKKRVLVDLRKTLLYPSICKYASWFSNSKKNKNKEKRLICTAEKNYGGKSKTALTTAQKTLPKFLKKNHQKEKSMTFKLSNRSLEKLEGVYPDLVATVKRAIEITEVDFGVTAGVRDIETQRVFART